MSTKMSVAEMRILRWMSNQMLKETKNNMEPV